MSQKHTCEKCSKPFLIIDQEAKFLTANNWPLPTECPDCRQARRMAMRNPRKLQKTTCDKCKKDIIVTFERKPKDVVYCKDHYREWFESSNHLVE